MLCFECGAEMRLVEVAKDHTMPVAGFEHRTWQCSGCSALEQRMTFSREKTPARTELVEPSRPALLQPTRAEPVPPIATTRVEPAQTQPIELVETAAPERSQTLPVAPVQTAPNEAHRAKPAEQVQTAGVEPTATVSAQPILTAVVRPPQTIRPIHPEPPAAGPQINARVKALEEKVRHFQERMTAARKVADDTKRRAQLSRNWENAFRSVPAPSAPSNVARPIPFKAAGHIRPDEPVLPPTESILFSLPTSDEEHIASRAPTADEEPIAFPAPASDDERISAVSDTPALTKFRKILGGLVKAVAPKIRQPGQS
jgi:hypothetical protein